jgi:hypothetical protein
MDICTICDGVADGSRVRDPETGDTCHPACLAELLPADAILALVAPSLLVLAPLVIVWAA